MSTQQKVTPSPSAAPQRPVRRISPALVIAFGVAAALTISIALLAWYANSEQFNDRVRRQVIATLEQTTGGRVELKSFRWQLFHLQVEVHDLTIHGLEGPGEISYAQIERLEVRAKVLSFFRPKIGLALLTADHPVFHLIVYPDGSTNQPAPKMIRNGKPLGDKIFDIAIDRVEVADGLAIVNERTTHFDIAAKNLAAVLTYKAAPVGRERYLVNVTVADLVAVHAKEPTVQSTMDLSLTVGRNAAEIQHLRLKTGPSLLELSGSLDNFAAPQWHALLSGRVDIREVESLTEVEGLRGGIAEIGLKAEGQGLTKFIVEGAAKLRGGHYTSQFVTLEGVDATTTIHATEDQLRLSNAVAKLQPGGVITGEFRLDNWLAPSSLPQHPMKGVPLVARAHKLQPEPIKPAEARGTIRAELTGVTLRTVLNATTPRRYQDLGFDTAATGPVRVDWLGLAADLTIAAKLTLAPSVKAIAGQVPLSGVVDAEYFNRNGTVQIRSLEAHTPATELRVQGALGVYPESRTSDLHGDVSTRNLAEFNRTLIALGLVVNGKHGSQALPIELQGQAEFHGDVTGTLFEPVIKGHAILTNFATLLPPLKTFPLGKRADVAPIPATPSMIVNTVSPVKKMQWDRLDATGEYSLEQISIQQATISRGAAVVHASGVVRPHRISLHRVDFDGQSAINATVGIQDGSVKDLLAIAGEPQIAVTGTITMNIHAGGTVNNLSGGGHVLLKGGDVYAEPFRSVNADLNFAGHDLVITELTLLQNGGQLLADGFYDMESKNFRAHATGRGFDLAHLRTLQRPKLAIGGHLVFEAHGSGNLDNPIIRANAHVVDVTLGDQQVGKLDAEAHSEHGILFYTTDSRLAGAQLQVSGQTELHGDYNTQAKLTFTDLDIDPFLRLTRIDGLTAHSSTKGQLTLHGPMKYPKRLDGEASISQFAVSMVGVPLQSDGQVHAVLRNGDLVIDPIHVTGEGTNLRAQGSMNVFGKGDLKFHAEGAINMKLAQTLNPDIASSGQVNFTLDARGTVAKPDLAGQVKFTNGAMALPDLPNGLSQMNGTLEFNQDRLDVKSLTAQTGGGQLKIGGYITFQQGLFGDLTATGKNIRIRYPQGISSMADANLRLLGSARNLLLSGSVLVTRFAINPDLDIAGLAHSPTSISPPVDPNAATNHVRLEIHITSAPALNFQNSFAKLAGDVDLRLRGTVAAPSILGRVNVTEGSATFAGTRYQLQHGDIFFTNPVRLDPTIDLDAVARVENYDITIGLHGTATKLNVSYRSEPPLAQSDVIALLALGRTQEEQSMFTQQQQNQGTNSTTNALLGGALNATVSSRVQKLFGVGSVKIDPTFVGTLGNSTARVTVEQQVARNVTLTFATNVNSTAQQLIQAQVDLTRNVSLVAVRDENGVFSTVVKVHRRYR